MAHRDMTIAEQLRRAAEAVEQIGSGKNTASVNGKAAHSSSPVLSPAPADSLSAELLRTNGLLRYGRG